MTAGTLPLHKPPAGLLAALDLKTLGHNPDALERGIRGTIDVYDQYLLAQQQVVTVQNTTTIATFLTLTLSVPQDTVYRVLGWSMGLSMDIADVALTTAVNFAISSGAGGFAGHTYLPPAGALTSTGLATFRTAAHYAERPLWLPGGWGLAMTVLYSGAGVTVAPVTTLRALVQVINLRN